MVVTKCNNNMRINCIDPEGFVRPFIVSDSDLEYFLMEIFDTDERVLLEDVDEPAKGLLEGCLRGEFIKHSANPDLVESLLDEHGLGCYCKIDRTNNLIHFNPKILNCICYKEKAPK